MGNRRCHPKNKTRYAILNKVAKDPRVKEIWDEGPNGIWAELVDGYNFEGCSTVHGSADRGDGITAVQDLIEQMKLVKKGDSY